MNFLQESRFSQETKIEELRGLCCVHQLPIEKFPSTVRVSSGDPDDTFAGLPTSARPRSSSNLSVLKSRLLNEGLQAFKV